MIIKFGALLPNDLVYVLDVSVCIVYGWTFVCSYPVSLWFHLLFSFYISVCFYVFYVFVCLLKMLIWVFVISDDELFTIKMFFNGDFEENPKRYSGGRVVYVDFCDSDMISLLEINTMLVDCGSRGVVTVYGISFLEQQWSKAYLS